MKKIFMTLSATATLVIAIAFSSCNNAEEVKKQVEEQNATIQTAVDEKLNALQETVNAECTATVDSIANVAYAEFLASAAKNTKGGGKKQLAKKPVATNPKEDRFKNPNGGKTVTKENTESKKDRFDNPDGGKKVTPEDTKKKGDRFK